jgi:hypothetical protein
MTIRTTVDLDAALAAGAGNRGVDAALIQDMLDSMKGVGGVMFAADVDPLPITSDWAPVTVMTGVRSTRGITEDLAGGLFTIGPGADGPYALDISFGIESQIAGWIEIGFTKNGQAPFSKTRRSLTAGGWGVFGIPDGIDLAEGDTIGIGIRGSGNAPTQIKLLDGTYRALRA